MNDAAFYAGCALAGAACLCAAAIVILLYRDGYVLSWLPV